MLLSKRLFFALLAFAALSFIACEKESLIDPMTQNRVVETLDDTKSSAGPLIEFTVGNICAKRSKPCAFSQAPYYFSQNSVKVRLNQDVAGFYTSLRYRIYKQGGSQNLVYDCTTTVTGQNVVLTPNGGLSNNAQYKVVVSKPNGQGANSRILTTGECSPKF